MFFNGLCVCAWVSRVTLKAENTLAFISSWNEHRLEWKGILLIKMLVFNGITDTHFNSSNRGVNGAKNITTNNEPSGLPAWFARYSQTQQIEEFKRKALLSASNGK